MSNNWIKGIDYPEWLTDESLDMLKEGYLQHNESPKELYKRVSKASYNHIKEAADKLDTTNKYDVEFEQRIFNYLWNNWLCLATPVASNLGTDKGLPISCYITNVEDSTSDIYNTNKEMAMLTKYGGGVGTTWNDVRAAGHKISKGGTTNGIIPFVKVYESTIVATSQGNTRRGAASVNLNIEHGDWEDFIKMRRTEGDQFRVCVNLHHCTEIDNDFMLSLRDKSHINHSKNKSKWFNLLKTRVETGESYIAYVDNINQESKTEWYNTELSDEYHKQRNKDYEFRPYRGTNICSECVAYLKSDETFTCCLSSLNIAKYDEWKGNSLFIQDCVYFLNGVLNEFIAKSEKIPSLVKAYNFAKRHRSIGLGWLGLHSYLQDRMIPFVSIAHRSLTKIIGKFVYDNAKQASKDLTLIYDEPEVMKGTGQYNSQLIAIAPTLSNSIISGGVSQGIEPIYKNIYKLIASKVAITKKNKVLDKLFQTKYNISPTVNEKQYNDLWDNIDEHKGSVQHLTFLTDDEKDVFKTFHEINQMGIIELAAIRQEYVDQSQSLNLAIQHNIPTKQLSDIHYRAWELGVKTLYYVRGENPLTADKVVKTLVSNTPDKIDDSELNQGDKPVQSDCVFCEG